jgi:hypothetical protein
MDRGRWRLGRRLVRNMLWCLSIRGLYVSGLLYDLLE